MHKVNLNHRPILFVVIAMAILVSACSKPYLVKPSDEYLGNVRVASIDVVKTDEVKSNTIVAAVKSKLQEDAADLNGAKVVDMKVTLDHLTIPLPGGSVTKTLIGSNTKLSGVVELFDQGKLISKFVINAEYSEAGLLGATTTISFVDTQTAVVRQFSAFTMAYLN